MQLSPAQQLAVTHKDGPMMVLAGPGSGKTFTITNRIRYLTEEEGIHPGEILVITFTKAAAEEMKERYEALVSEQNGMVNFGTFHAVFFKILRYAYRLDASNILREEERYQILKEIIAACELDITDEKEFIETISSELSLVKSERIALSSYYSLNCPEQTFAKIYTEYETKLRERNRIDFDDMLTMCYELFEQRPDILAMWQKKYKYILIDEFQDINKIQYDIIRMLALPENNLFIVGDDDQSIYRFRGAKPEIMLRFPNDYPNTKQVVLSENYRSCKKIVDGALRVVKNNTKRYEKDLQAVKGEGTAIVVKNFRESSEECEYVLHEIRRLHGKGIPYKEMAVLFRTNTQTRTLVGKLMEYNVPFVMRDSIPSLYEHWITKNMLAYIKMALGDRSRTLFLQIMNRPKRYLSRSVLTEETVDFMKLKKAFAEKSWMVERLEKLEYDLAMLAKTGPYAALQYIRRAIGYDEYLTEYAEYRRMSVDELFDTLAELQEDAKNYATYEEWFAHMDEYQKELAKQSKERRKNADAVTLATYHSSKGLEYEAVFLPQVNEGLTPYKKAILPEDLEEERRMFYVGMTRAKRYLSISYIKELRAKELQPSRFVGELLFDTAGLQKGTRVIHKTYGKGTLIKKEGDRLTIQFDKIKGVRMLSEAYCKQAQLLRVEE